MRVLVSARDAGAAHQNRAFVDACLRQRRRFEFEVLLQAPALEIFGGCSAQMRPVDGPVALHSLVASTFDKFKPDFVLIGLSAFGDGVDEAVLWYAKRHGIPSGAIQDYWGYLGNLGTKVYPDVFFVLDEKAKQLTSQRTRGAAHIEVTGSPKHEAYRSRVEAWRQRDRNQTGAGQRVVFFLQPRGVPGLIENVALFLGALDQVDLPVSAAIMLHPSDTNESFLAGLLSSSRTAIKVIVANQNVEVELGRADVVATCFSTVGLDHNYMQLYSAQALGSLLYLTAGERIKAFMREVIGSETVPGADMGMGASFDSAEGLAPPIPQALSDDRERKRYRRAVHANLAPRRSPSSSIADYIENQHDSHQQEGGWS